MNLLYKLLGRESYDQEITRNKELGTVTRTTTRKVGAVLFSPNSLPAKEEIVLGGVYLRENKKNPATDEEIYAIDTNKWAKTLDLFMAREFLPHDLVPIQNRFEKIVQDDDKYFRFCDIQIKRWYKFAPREQPRFVRLESTETEIGIKKIEITCDHGSFIVRLTMHLDEYYVHETTYLDGKTPTKTIDVRDWHLGDDLPVFD